MLLPWRLSVFRMCGLGLVLIMILSTRASSVLPGYRQNRFQELRSSFMFHVIVWAPDTSHIRDRLVEVPDARTTRLYLQMIEQAHLLGFDIQAPDLQQIPASFDTVLRIVPGRIYAMHYAGSSSKIVVDNGIASRMNDHDLSCLLGHEIGHAIDEQLGRESHPLTQQLSSVSSQQFAHVMGGILCGFEDYFRFAKYWLLS